MTDINVPNPEFDPSSPEYNPVTDPLSPMGKDCTVCSTEYEDDNWGTMGWIGILPISLCPNCDQGIHNMVMQQTDVETLREWINEKFEEMNLNPIYAEPYDKD
jgi:hypothetical protein